jgi:hypothetical protein
MEYITHVSLADHITGCANNSLATLREEPLLVGLVAEVHGFYSDAVNVAMAVPEGAGLFLGMSHGAYLAATQLATSGQLPPTYAITRMCVEHALVGHRVFRNPQLKPVWIGRDANAQATAAFRKAFRYKTMQAELDQYLPHVGHQLSTVYEGTITLGAHPNPAALLTNLRQDPNTDAKLRTKYLYVNTDPIGVRQALYTVAFGGITALTVFAYLYMRQFPTTDLPHRLLQLYKFANQFAPNYSVFGEAEMPVDPGAV